MAGTEFGCCGEPGGEQGSCGHGISSRLDGHQQGRCHGAFSPLQPACLPVLTHLQPARGLQESRGWPPPALTADLPTQPPAPVWPLPPAAWPPFLPEAQPSSGLASLLCQPSSQGHLPLGPPAASPLVLMTLLPPHGAVHATPAGLLQLLLPPKPLWVPRDTPSLNLPSERPEQTCSFSFGDERGKKMVLDAGQTLEVCREACLFSAFLFLEGSLPKEAKERVGHR